MTPSRQLTFDDLKASIHRLSDAQFNALSQIYMGNDSFLHPSTAKALVKKGLVERYETSGIGWPPLIIYRYRESCVAAHIAWAEVCSEQEEAPNA